MHMPRKKKVNARAKRQPAKAAKGEQVFGGNVDEILAERIVERARANASEPEPPPASEQNQEPASDTPRAGRNPLLRIAAVGAVLAGIALLLVGSLGRKERGKSRKRK